MVSGFTKYLFYSLSLMVSCSGFAGVLENASTSALPGFISVDGIILPAAIPSGSGAPRSRKAVLKTGDGTTIMPLMSGISETNPNYWRRTFTDEFKGRPATEPSPGYNNRCYGDFQPTCMNCDGSNFATIPCSGKGDTNVTAHGDADSDFLPSKNAAFPKLKDLNKCVWALGRSYEYWGNVGMAEFDPKQVEVNPSFDNGLGALIIHAQSTTGTDASFASYLQRSGDWQENLAQWEKDHGYHCMLDTPSGSNKYPTDQDYRTRNCPVRTGAIYSHSGTNRASPYAPNVDGFSQTYGLIQIRAKLQPPGNGSFPALWMLPKKDGWWPSCFELDIADTNTNFQNYIGGTDSYEHFDTNGKSLGSYSQPITIGSNPGNSKALTPTKHDNTYYHNYSIERSADDVYMRVDGVRSLAVAKGEKLNGPDGPMSPAAWKPWPNDPFYLLIDHQLGWTDHDGLPNPDGFKEQDLYVDYVRAWEKCDLNAPTGNANGPCPNGGTFDGRNTCVKTFGKANQSYRSLCTRCLYGGEDVGDAAYPHCDIQRFKSPDFYPGIKYWVDNDLRWPGVYYKKINGECPAGGGSAGPNCSVIQLWSAANLLPASGVSFWVDTDPRWPGVYYNQVSGACPYGGTLSGAGHCAWSTYGDFSNLVSGVGYYLVTDPRWPGVYFPTDSHGQCGYGHGNLSSDHTHCEFKKYNYPAGVNYLLVPGTNYWVDTDPRYPGVYYRQNPLGSCAYGGTISGDGNCQLLAKSFPIDSPGHYSPVLTPGVQYWVDADQRWPGVFYRQVNPAPQTDRSTPDWGDSMHHYGYDPACPYGGSSPFGHYDGGNCTVMLFAPGVLEDQINYQITTDRRWPVVYYMQTY